MSKKILIIAGDFPYPANHGGRVDIYERIISLKKMNFNITLIATVKEHPKNNDVDYMKKYCNEIIIIPRQLSIVNIFSNLPYQIKSRINKKEILKIKFQQKEYDFLILEGHYLIGLFEKIRDMINVKKVFLRVHNDEVVYFSQLSNATDSFFKKIFYQLESIKFDFYEANIFKKNIITNCLHISFDECENYKIKYPKINHIFSPASLDVTNFVKINKKGSKTVLFIGSLFMPNNINGLKWYLEKIHSQIVDIIDNYKFIVAGNTKGINVKELENYLSKFENIDFHNSPENLGELYNISDVFINPMLSGAGVKLKTINAIKEGLPVVSTIIGNEGTGLVDKTHILVAKDQDEFLKSVILLLENDKMKSDIVEEAQKFLKKNYNQIENLTKILQ